MTDELVSQIADWIEFFRDLGFEDFYRGPELESLMRNWLSDVAVEPVVEASTQSRVEAVATAAESPATAASTVPPIAPEPAKAPLPPPAGLRPQAPTAEAEERERGTPPTVPAAVLEPRIALPTENGLRMGPPRSSEARSMNLFEAEPSPPGLPERETLDQIRTVLGDCHRCKLAAGRKHIVFGQGNPKAELVFVGEGPGADEDEQGLPFVGRAGQLLNRMLQRVDIRREDVYICNVVKCRPPGNRTPEKDEVDTCSPFLFRQIRAIEPRLICCLGIPAVRTVLGIKEGITRIHGRFYDYGTFKAMATVHPAYVLRNPREERILVEDFQKIRDFLNARS
ncbi:MAG: uracil-DNA glycosylase family protein [Terriglobia bacterium]